MRAGKHATVRQRRSPAQLSATISQATKEKLDRFAESHGLKKNFVVEQALLCSMEARRELPDEALVPARVGERPRGPPPCRQSAGAFTRPRIAFPTQRPLAAQPQRLRLKLAVFL